MGKTAGEQGADGPYWEDRAYQYVSRRHRSAVDSGDDTEATRLATLMAAFVSGTVPEDIYEQLSAEAKADRDKQKQERKKHGKSHPPRVVNDCDTATVNVSDLKRRIFSSNVSRENIIRALEALPPAEKKATIAGLPPGLRRKLGEYLKGGER